MQKLLAGIVEFRRTADPARRERLRRLARGQAPDALLVTCSDSRVAPNWFASTDPGDLFVVRNVGNLVPTPAESAADASVAAAVEFALTSLDVRDAIVCGHSECGAIRALKDGLPSLPPAGLRRWLEHGAELLRFAPPGVALDPGLPERHRLSQLNALLQARRLATHPLARERRAQGRLRLHAWWFDIAEGAVYAFDESAGRFAPIDERLDPASAARLTAGLSPAAAP